jgi:hypothetical protein
MKSHWRAPFLVVFLSAPILAWAQSSTTPSTSPSTPSSSSTPSTSPSPSSSSSTQSFDSLDANHDGVLSKDEFKAGVSQQSDQQQAGHGGGHHGGGFGGPGGGGGGGFGGGSPGGGFGGGGFGGQHPTGGPGGSGGQYGGHHGGNRDRTNLDQMFENLDTNHDGVLSRDEFAAMAHGGASNKDSGTGNYHSSNPHPSNNAQSPSQN